ncbi:hypothetical protein DQ04_03331020 [Trypanosoma grayi]|uniref:hypothetical protein n=1 Tax=Trypanosoma grayi TaxID=71804 RepID=UPI0004F4565A|nr:hypothetical protein DQ04_03331020 [Trypanosoma grayi]KEG10758.1 hypothetical protein DQ04_03331020 [Trypanosoma grayi]
MHRSFPSLSVWKVLCSELGKIPAVLRFHAGESTASVAKVIDSWKGENPDENPQVAAKRREHRQAYEEILRQQQQRARAASEEAMQGLSFAQSLKARASAAVAALKEATSTNAGVMALLQHCTASHAAEVAVEQGIDVKNVTMRLEKQKSGAQVGHETVVVGYIDAPNASEAEVMAFAERLQKRCPVAHSMEGRIEWRSVASSNADASNNNNDNNKGNRNGQQESDDAIPHGTPGARRYVSPHKKGHGGLEDPDELHLPGTRPRTDGTESK